MNQDHNPLFLFKRQDLGFLETIEENWFELVEDD